MADYNSAFTGTQIDSAVEKVLSGELASTEYVDTTIAAAISNAIAASY